MLERQLQPIMPNCVWVPAFSARNCAPDRDDIEGGATSRANRARALS